MGKPQFLATLLLASIISPGRAASARFEQLRFDESFTNDADAPHYKHLDLDVLPGSHLSLGGEIREKFEAVRSPRYGFGEPTDSHLFQRVLIHGNVHVGDRVRLFAQLGWHAAYGKKVPATSLEGNHPDLQQAFVDLSPKGEPRLTLRLGRQEVMFNEAQRFISVREGGPNVRLSFDGAKVTWRDKSWSLDALIVSPVKVDPGSFDDRRSKEEQLWGIHATRRIGSHSSLAAYLLGLHRKEASVGDQMGAENRRSLGVRATHSQASWQFDAELVHQFGDFEGRHIRAWGLGLDASYLLQAPWQPRLGVQVIAGTGERADNEGRVTGFFSMYPRGVYASWTNAMAVRPMVTIAPHAALSAQFGVQWRWRENVHDAVYVHPQIPLIATLGNTERAVSTVATLDTSWQVNPYLRLNLLLTRVNAELAVRKAGGKDIRYIVFTSQLKF